MCVCVCVYVCVCVCMRVCVFIHTFCYRNSDLITLKNIKLQIIIIIIIVKNQGLLIS